MQKNNKSIDRGKSIDNKFEELYCKNLILSCDTECFPDYWNFIFKRIGQELNVEFSNYKQIRYNPKTQVYIFECWNDNDCREFADFYKKFILRNKAIMYFYNSTGYDQPMINIMLNLALNSNTTNILKKLRQANDYIIKNKVNYRLFYKKYWQNFFKDNRKRIDEKELFDLFPNLAYKKFYDEFNNCFVNKATKIYHEELGKSIEVSKILDIQAIAGFSPAQKKKTDEEGTNLSLKQLQLVHLGYNQKFDFNKYSTMNQVIKDGYYNTFISYSENDVTSLEYMYYKYVEQHIKDRYLMIKAIRESKLKDINYESKLIFTSKETHTELITKVLELENGQKDFKIDYTDHIKTEIPEFNKFVEFVNDNQNVKSESELKAKYKEITGNTVPIFKLNGVEVTGGYGGGHGAIPKYINNTGNLFDFDYTSQYPCTIIQYAEYFKNIINVELYKKIYELRIKHKKSSKDKSLNENERNKYKQSQLGLKLILNSVYGLINSDYSISISNKVLGRFIVLKCQSLLYNLCTANKDLITPNLNTDGVYFEIEDQSRIQQIIEDDYKRNGEGYYKLEVDSIENIIQKDVNTYIAKLAGEKAPRIKGGEYNLGIKKTFNTNSKIDINMKNGIRLLFGEEIEIQPVYFKGMKNINCDKAHYLTTKDKGINPVNNNKYPVKLSIDNNDIYVTENKEDVDFEVYKFFAELTKNKIQKFDTGIQTYKHYDHILTNDTDENNKILNKNVNRIKKLLNIKADNIGYSGFMGIAKKATFYNGNPINPLINYKKSEIINSVESQGVIVHAKNQLIIIDIDIFDKNTKTYKEGYNTISPMIDKLNKIETYQTWNDKTKDFLNRKIIFRNDINKILDINDKYKKYIEIVDSSVVWTMEGLDRQYFDNNIPAVNVSDHRDIIDELTIVKNENAIEYIEKKIERENKLQESITQEGHSNIVIDTAINLLNSEGIEIIEMVDKNSEITTLTFNTPCPYCSTTNRQDYNSKYQGLVNAYINLNKSKDSYYLHFYNLSHSCKNDKNHEEYYKELNKKFKEALPDKEHLKRLELFNDICENIDKKKLKELDENLLIPNTCRIVGTGGHKTFQSARKLIENVFVKNIFHIHSTKENKHISDFEREVKKILSMVLINRTEIIDQFLDNENQGFKELNIHKLMISKGINENTLHELKGVVTNHTYWYRNGHSSEPNRNMAKVIDFIKDKPPEKIETVIDEYESFKKKGVIDIDINGYEYINMDMDKEETLINAPSCLFPATQKIVKDHNLSQFLFANEHNNIEMIEHDGVWKYKIDRSGNKNFKKFIDKYTYQTGQAITDSGRRQPKCIVTKTFEHAYITVDQVKQYNVKDIPEEDLKNYDFLKLIKTAKRLAIVRKIIKVGEIPKIEDTEEKIKIDVNNWGTEIETIEELKEYGMELKQNNISFEGYKNQLKKEVGDELFIDTLLIYTPATLEKIPGIKYYLTANVPRNITVPINTELAYKSSDCLKNIDVCIIKREKNSDDKLLDNLKLLQDRDFKTLAFTALSTNINKLINSEVKTNYIRIRGTVIELENGKTKTISYNTDEAENIYDSVKQTVTLSYINGTESQGRNYSQTDLLWLNCKVQANIKGRVDIDKDNNIVVIPIEEETRNRLKQAIGRIFRGNQEYKAIICFGEEDTIRELFNSYPDNFTINFNIETYNKKLDTNKGTQEALSDIINYYEYKLGYSEEVPHFNIDKRKTSNDNAKKYDEEEIYNYYRNRVKDYYKEHKKKLKDTEIKSILCEKFGISPRQFDRIKKKFK